MRGMSGGGFRLNAHDPNASDTSSIASTTTTTSTSAATPGGDDVGRRIWTETQWVNLSRQARDLGLPKLPYFDAETMVLSKEVNRKLWRQLVCFSLPAFYLAWVVNGE
jgi:hypothetical protein